MKKKKQEEIIPISLEKIAEAEEGKKYSFNKTVEVESFPENENHKIKERKFDKGLLVKKTKVHAEFVGRKINENGKRSRRFYRFLIFFN